MDISRMMKQIWRQIGNMSYLYSGMSVTRGRKKKNSVTSLLAFFDQHCQCAMQVTYMIPRFFVQWAALHQSALCAQRIYHHIQLHYLLLTYIIHINDIFNINLPYLCMFKYVSLQRKYFFDQYSTWNRKIRSKLKIQFLIVSFYNLLVWKKYAHFSLFFSTLWKWIYGKLFELSLFVTKPIS